MNDSATVLAVDLQRMFSIRLLAICLVTTARHCFWKLTSSLLFTLTHYACWQSIAWLAIFLFVWVFHFTFY